MRKPKLSFAAAADTVLCIPFFRNILKKNYGYLRSGRA